MKNLFTFRWEPNESLTHRGLIGSISVVGSTVKGRSSVSQVSAKCRSSVGRLSTLFLLLIALSFGFNQQAWGATERYIYCGISNTYQNKKDANNWGFNFWGGTSEGVKSPTWIQDNYKWDNRNYTIYRVKVYDNNNKAQIKVTGSWWDPGNGYSVTLNGTTKNAVFFSNSDDGWGGQFQENYQETSTGSLSAGSSTTTVGTQVTLTPALTSNSDVNEIKSTTYSVTTNPGSAGSVSNGKFSATAAGTYVIKATITYNPKGFTGITKTVDATTTITVEANYTVSLVANPSAFGNVSVSSVQAGSVGKASISATANNCYSFVNWTGTTGISFDDANSASTKVAATQAGTATANFSERFYLRGSLKDNSGNEGMPGWGNDAPFVYANSEFAVTCTLTAGKVYKFMIFDKTANKQKGCTDNSGNYVIPWNTNNTCDGNYQICFTANVNGDYKFVVEQNGDNPRIKVIPPSQTIDLYKDGNKIRTIPATFGQAFDKSVLELPADTAKTGYIFGGFYDVNANSGGKGVISKASNELRYTGNNTYGTNGSGYTWCYTETTLNAYARYSAKTYTVTLPGGGGTNDQNGSIQVTYDSKTANNFTTPTKEGYSIRSTNAFCADAELTQGVFTQSGNISNNTNTYLTSGAWTYDWTDSKNAPVIYTAWTAQQYTLTLDDNNGTSTTSTKTVTYDANTNLTQKVTIPTKTGQDFTGYWTNTNGTGSQLVGSDGYFLNEVSGYIKATKLWGYANNLTIYAGWANHAYTITYKDQGDKDFSGDWGTTVHPTTHTYNTATTLVAAPNKTGYTFGGWFISSDCTGQAVTELGATAYTADITLYAKWNPTTTTITLYRNDGTDAYTTHVATYDGAATAITNLIDAVRTRAGYSHNGMYAANTGGNFIIKYDNGWKYNSTVSTYATSTQWRYTGETLDLYSHWSANNYTITFNQYEPTTAGDASKEVTFDASVSNINVPAKTGLIFSGYWTGEGGTGTEVFTAAGALVANASGYTSNGKWIYANNITLHAYWATPADQVVNFGITDGSALSNTLGTITAKVDGNAITSGDKVASGKEVVFEYSAAKGSVITSINGTKLQNWYNGVNVSSATSYSITQNKCTLTVSASTINAYAHAQLVEELTVSTAVNPVGKGEVTSNNDFHCGANLNTTLTAVNPAGYDFVNWTADDNGKVQFTGETNVSPINVAVKDAGHTVTANFAIHPYSITYNGLQEGDENNNPETYTIETETITLQEASRAGYTFDGWYDAETDGNQVTSIELGSTGDMTLWARWHQTDFTVYVVVNDANGGSIITPESSPITAHYQVPFAIEAQENTGYTFVDWTVDPENSIEFGVSPAENTGVSARKLANNAELSEASDKTLTSSATIIDDAKTEITITANFTENLSAVTISSNNTDYGTVNVNNASVGVTTTQQLVATNKPGYKFKEWQLSGGAVLHSGAMTDATITIKGDGTSDPGTATAVFVEDLTANWYIRGDKGLLTQCANDWEKNEAYRFSKPSIDAQSAYIDIAITDGQVGHTYEFKLQDCGVAGEPMYGWGTGDGYYHTFTHTETFGIYNNEGSDHNLKIIPAIAGTYRFSIDWSSESEHNLTVTFPTGETYDVTISAGDNGAVSVEGVQQIDAVEGLQVTATPDPGYRFKEWVTTGGVTVTNATDATTTAKATAAGTLQATFTTEGMIYFNKAGIKDKWTGDVYVYFYNGEYWDTQHNPSKGSGSKTTGDATCTSGPHKMNRLGNSDIYYFDYTGAGITKQSSVISFTDQYLSEADNFYKCSASYRTDFHTCANMFVPRDYIDYYNECAYYSKGYWRTFQSTDPGYDIHIWNNHDGTGDKKASGDFVGTSNLSNEFTFTANLDANHTYGFKISSCGTTWYGNQGTMTQDCNWEFDSEGSYENNCGLTTTSAGEYKFTLNCTNGWLYVSVEYPLSKGDYRLAYEELSGSNITKIHPTHHIKALSEDGTKVDTVSFFAEKKANAYIYLQKCTDIQGTNITWANEGAYYVDLSNFAQAAGVYNFTLTQTKSGTTLTPAVALLEAYEGPYYIRTDCAGGGWSSYNIKDNEMTQSDVLKRNMAGKGDYNYYFAQWVSAGTNVKYCVANNYSEALTDSLKADTYTTVAGHDEAANQTLPADASVRFMYNNTTNTLERAYLNGSTYEEDRYLMLIGDNSESGGKYIYNVPATSTDDPVRFTNDEIKLEDKGNWTYQIDIKADVTARGKLVATYNGKEQYFKGKEGAFAEETTEQIIGGDEKSTTKYGVRIVYDFKTNNMVAGWMPSNTEMPIEEQMAIYADVIIIRHEQNAASQITFSGSGKLTEVKTVYGAIEFRKEDMVGRMNTWTDITYKNCMYYISFPFDVKVSEIFGLGTYGDTWLLQYYDGAERASKGWFAETKTFWKDVDFNDTLKANVGYSFLIDRPTFNDGGSSIWKNTANDASVYIYFPSIKEVSGIQQKESLEVTVPEHPCKIQRTFEVGDRTLSHTFTDSHWNMMGVPVFQDVDGSPYSSIFLAEEEEEEEEEDATTPKFGYLYAWDYSNNTLHIQDVTEDDFEFKAMHSYMVQYAGTITWTGSTVTPAAIAARQIGEKKDYTIDLQLNYNNARVARTYIELREGANADFMLNEDVYMMTNSAAGNIYSLAGSYDVAANVLPEQSQIVPLGVIANKSGEFTFTMPSNFSGTVTLVDKVANTETDLQLQDYTVTLNKGTYEGRFELKLNIERTIGTDFNGADYQGGKPEQFKFIRDNRLHILLPNGRIFNALGGRTK